MDLQTRLVSVMSNQSTYLNKSKVTVALPSAIVQAKSKKDGLASKVGQNTKPPKKEKAQRSTDKELMAQTSQQPNQKATDLVEDAAKACYNLVLDALTDALQIMTRFYNKVDGKVVRFNPEGITVSGSEPTRMCIRLNLYRMKKRMW
jgi:hypothetical protein